MTDTSADRARDERDERHALIEKLQAEAMLMTLDRFKRGQDIAFAPFTLLATGIGAGAALLAAGTAFGVALARFLQH